MSGWYWHELGRSLRRMFRCEAEKPSGERCRNQAAWGKRRTARGRSERMLCTIHASLDPDWPRT